MTSLLLGHVTLKYRYVSSYGYTTIIILHSWCNSWGGIHRTLPRVLTVLFSGHVTLTNLSIASYRQARFIRFGQQVQQESSSPWTSPQLLVTFLLCDLWLWWMPISSVVDVIQYMQRLERNPLGVILTLKNLRICSYV